MSPTSEKAAGWPAPVARGPVSGSVVPPGSKSATNRYLILAALAAGPSTLHGVLRARDTSLMMDALTLLGCNVEPLGSASDDVVVIPSPLHGPARVDVGQAGTILRFLPAIAAGSYGRITFVGDPETAARPITPLLQALRTLGAQIEGDALPFTVVGHGPLPGGEVEVDAAASSQFISALLLAAPAMTTGLHVRSRGGAPVSGPHIAMTLAALRHFGARVDVGADGASWRVGAGRLTPVDAVIEPDLTNAAVFLAAAAVTGGSVTVPTWPATTDQPGALFPHLLVRMGARVTQRAVPGSERSVALSVHGTSHVRGISQDMSAAGELVPTLAAVAALATSPTRLSGIGHLRGHETDRLAAIQAELTRLGGSCQAGADDLTIAPLPLHGGTVRCYADHRLAMFGAIIGLRVPGVVLDDVQATTKTLPDFAARWNALVAG